MKKILLVLVCILFLVIPVFAQEYGCCCSAGTAQKGSLQKRGDCQSGYLFTPLQSFPLTSPETICQEACGQLTAPEIPTVSQKCEDPGYNPPPRSLTVNPVRGRSHLKLIWNQECPVSAYTIERCEGQGCTDFSIIASIGPGTSFLDISQLKFDTPHRYRMTSHYVTKSDSDTIIATGNPGDLECKNQFSETPFCISALYYYQYEDYLKEFGYRVYTAEKFRSDFESTIQESFFYNFNRAFHCNEKNRVIDEDPDCQNIGGICMADERGARCIEESDCAINPEGTSFGFGYSIASCEGAQDQRKFCFYDKSFSLIDTCYSCKTFMNCYDYKSKHACERDNCAVGNCDWISTYDDIGIGVCIDRRFDNCDLCQSKGTSYFGEVVESINAYNEIYDQCTKAKSDALSSEEFKCFFDPADKGSKGCEAITCFDYSKDECGSPIEGINLDEDNNIIQTSNDPCGLGVCEYFPIIEECAKNADGKANIGGDKRDCAGIDNREICEKDIVPPKTTLKARSNSPGQIDFIDVIITDQVRDKEASFFVSSRDSYPLHICGNPFNESPCTNFISTTTSQFNLNNLELKDNDQTILTLTEGPYTLRFYAEDPSHNLENVQELIFAVCSDCQGPKLLNISVEPSKKHDDRFYSNSQTPRIKLHFNTNTLLTVHKLIKDTGEEFDTSLTTTGATSFDLRPKNSLPEGSYTLRLFGKSTSGIEMDQEEETPIIIDKTSPKISLLINNEEINKQTITSKTATLTVNSSEPIEIIKAILNSWKFTDYALIEEKFNLSLSASQDSTTHTDSITSGEGRNKVFVETSDFAENPTQKEGEFFIHTEGPIFRLKSPSFGVSPTIDFPLEIESHNPALCTFWFNPIQPIPPDNPLDWEDFAKSNDRIHSKNIKGDMRGISVGPEYDLYVYCIDNENRESQKAFKISLDDTPPSIIFADAFPNPIAEKPFTTTFTVITDDLTFCKYSPKKLNYEDMQPFPLFEIEGKTNHKVDVTVDSIGEYNYHIACKNLAELGPVTTNIPFSVQDDVELEVKPDFPIYTSDLEFTFRVKTNKKAFCFYESPDEGILKTSLGGGDLKRTHEVNITFQEGKHSFIVTCSTGKNTVQGVPETKTKTIEFFVDTTPPSMVFVDDTSPILDSPEYSPYKTRLQVRFKGEDQETFVSKYITHILKGEEIIAERTYSEEYSDKAFFITNLQLDDKTSYIIRVTPVNIVGLLGDSMDSDGVTTDFSIIPPQCLNGILDEDESDIDCGGICELCPEGKACNSNEDCASRKCILNICAPPSCKDSIWTPIFESDIDCGGNCPNCPLNKKCYTDHDCISDFCSPSNICEIPGPCFNKILDGSETDIDCGGSCPTKCGPGKNCLTNDDCEENAACIDIPSLGMKKCKVFPKGVKDTDRDGIPDDWEIEHGLDPNDPSDANLDPDNDGLTNIEEFKHKTNPLNPDTDGDGWKDGIEIAQGFDPLDPASHPTSLLWWFLIIFVIILVLFFIGYGGYSLYTKRKSKKKIEKRIGPKIKKPVPPYTREIEQLKEFEKKPIKKEPELAFEKLQKIGKGKKEPSTSNVLKQLKSIASSKTEKEEITKALKRLSRGELSRKEKEDLFEKLRITAGYYESNKKELQRKFKEWLEGKKLSKKSVTKKKEVKKKRKRK